uniref:Tudor domain-containing protein n=1 Tax=Macrostomum lignano TaxID=282301 RepID=A0A1I8IDI7_9PLAT
MSNGATNVCSERLAQVKSAWVSAIIHCCRQAVAPLDQNQQDCQQPLPLSTQAEIQTAFEARFYAVVPRDELQSMARKHVLDSDADSQSNNNSSFSDPIDAIVNRFLFQYLRVDEGLNRELTKCTFYQDVIRRLKVAGEKFGEVNSSVQAMDAELRARTIKFNELEAGLRAQVTVIELSDSDKDSDDDVVIIDDPTKSHQRRREGHGDGLVGDTLTLDIDSDDSDADVLIVDGPPAPAPIPPPPPPTSVADDSATTRAEPTAAGVSIPPASKVRRLDNGEAASSTVASGGAAGVGRRVVLTAPVKLLTAENLKNLITTDLKVHVGESVFALRDQDEWCRAVVTHELPRDAYVVRFLGAPTLAANQQPTQPQPQLSRTVQPVQMALGDSCLTRQERCPVGTRVVSTVADPDYADEGPDAEADGDETPRYAGIVAESPGEANKFRYLIFFDDGYCQYSEQAAVHRVLAQSVNNWRLAGPESRFFIRDYLDAYPTRDLLRLQPGQAVVAELRGGWHNARVEAVDGALIRLTFMHDGSCEWISFVSVLSLLRSSLSCHSSDFLRVGLVTPQITFLSVLFPSCRSCHSSDLLPVGLVTSQISFLSVLSLLRSPSCRSCHSSDPLYLVTPQISFVSVLSLLRSSLSCHSSDFLRVGLLTRAAQSSINLKVYRGSTRLKTLYDRLYGPPKQQQQQPKQKPVQVQVSAAVVASQARVGHARKSTSASRLASSKSTANAAEDDDDFVYIGSTGRRRRRRDNGDSDDDSVAQDAAYRGRQVATFDPESPCPQPRLYRPHRCSPSCCPDPAGGLSSAVAFDDAAARGRNPLEAPVALGWWRLLVLAADDDGGVGGGGGGGGGVGGPAGRGREVVEYRAPCGRSLRSHADLDAYLRETCCRLHVSAFCFDAAVRINNEFQPLKIIYQLKDISYGKEPVPVSAVNSLDNTSLPYIEYAAERVPTQGVNTNESEPGFLVCCDCTDDCSDRRRCACQQLTIRSSQAITGKADIRVTYRHGRHMARALGGIYECNAKCRCRAATCRNRVVQHGLRNRL